MLLFTPFRFLADILITSILWIYFTVGFVLGFIPYIVWVAIQGKLREQDFQRYYHLFFRGFFGLLQCLSPTLSIRIAPEIHQIKSSIVICNHLSYLDPLMMISIFEKQKTIVKSTFFKVPLFSWLMQKSGYIPSNSEGKNLARVLRHVGEMKEYLREGGNLFVFPEGTRSRDNTLSTFNKGAFNIANQSEAPINVLYLKNTNQLFTPGSFFFKTWRKFSIELESVGVITTII